MSARLDADLVRRGLARSRRSAADLVAAGRVRVDGLPARKPAQPVPEGAAVTLEGASDPWVSRAAHKLLGALTDTGLDVAGRLCLDAGASTGGFTQVLLSRGAAHVVAVDVGHDQMTPELARDPRVTLREGLNVRDLSPADVAPPGAPAGTAPDVVVADLSFISLTLALPALLAVARPGTQLVLLVKPQFEVGRGRLGRGGVVTSDTLRTDAVTAVARTALTHGAALRTAAPSRLAGESGNREHVLHVEAGPLSGGVGGVDPHGGTAALPDDIAAAVERSVRSGAVVRWHGGAA